LKKLKRWLIAAFAFSCLAGCIGIEFNNVEAEQNEQLARDPDLAWHLDSLKIPQDDSFHFGFGVGYVPANISASPARTAAGWSVNLSACHAVPFVLRPRPTPQPTPTRYK
jgi:hypothetical protein